MAANAGELMRLLGRESVTLVNFTVSRLRGLRRGVQPEHVILKNSMVVFVRRKFG
jgi:hypothetical protein